MALFNKKTEEKPAAEATPAAPGEPRALPGTAGADAIVRKWTLWSAGLGLVPVPLLDFATTTAFSLKMLHSLSKYYNTTFRADVGKSAITSLLGGAAAPMASMGLSSVVKGVPIVGIPLAVVSGAVMSGAITYAIGRVFTAHFGSGGTLFDFDPEKFREYFQEQIEAGKAFIKRKTDGEAKADAAAAAAP
ncbi:MAG: DUF697 domain-containing protein [Myxococcales bacterium]|nr:DUF697 domain-containing protein [Myxococcales bacterium]